PQAGRDYRPHPVLPPVSRGKGRKSRPRFFPRRSLPRVRGRDRVGAHSPAQKAQPRAALHNASAEVGPMKRIYEASHSVEAHMIVHLLEQEGVRAYVQGEHLQSGAGELPLGNLVAVAVEDEDESRARAVIREWERQQGPPDRGAQATSTASTQWGVA